MLESGATKLKRRAISCCVVVALAFCSALAMGAIADAPTSNQAFAASKIKTAKIVDAGNKNKTVTKKTINMALTGRNSTNLKVVATPAKGAIKSIKWYSTSKKVASVSSKGHVVAKKKGTATIKAKVKAFKGKSRTLYVKVKVSTGGWQKSGKVTKVSTCSKNGTQIVKSLDGWKSKTVASPLAAHKFGSDWKCVVCGKQGGGFAIAKTAVNLATGAEGTSKDIKIYKDKKDKSKNFFAKDSDFETVLAKGDGKRKSLDKSKPYYRSSRAQADAYNSAFDSVGMNTSMKEFQYPDCGYNAIVAVRYSGVMKDFCNWSGSKSVKYIRNKSKTTTSLETSGKWKKMGTYYRGKTKGFGSLQPGDILVHEEGKEAGSSGSHVRIYVGYDAVKAKYPDADEGLWFSDAAYGDKKYPYLNTEGKTGTESTVYRYVG